MRKIIDYKTITCEQEYAMVDYQIKYYIDDGWQPYGNQFFAGNLLYQVMVKYEDDCDHEFEAYLPGGRESFYNEAETIARCHKCKKLAADC